MLHSLFSSSSRNKAKEEIFGLFSIGTFWIGSKSWCRHIWVNFPIFILVLFFGCSEVIKAKHLSNGKVVALKKIFTKSEQEGFPITSLREIKLLKNVSHQNVASLIDMAVSYKTSESDLKEVEDVFMVFPFMDHDLSGMLENQNISLTLPQMKCYMKQMLEGIAYLHQVCSN